MEGLIKPLNAEEQLLELKNLIEGIKVDTYFTCDHVSNYLFTERGPIFTEVHGRIPEDKEEMLRLIEDTLETVKALRKTGVEVFTSDDMFRMGLISL
ncbi:MAG: hypothetical protein QXT98_07480 [Archaeoglobaceae archaeon]